MNATRCNAAARLLMNGWPRRRLLATLAGVLGAGSALPEPALACKNVGRKCEKNNDCCNGARCGGKKCKCKSGFSKCNKKCYDLDKDDQNCGACSTACVSPDACCDGVCSTICVR